jgi:multimeric flavodoxin WrbA
MTIKILGICGSPIKSGNTQAFLEVALDAANGISDDVETDLVTLAGKEINSCKHCHWCERKQGPDTLPCSIKDGMVDIWHKLFEADGLLLASPAYMGRMTGYMACFIDRLRSLGHGNYYTGVMVNKVAGALAVLWFRDAGAEATLMSLLWGIHTTGMIAATGFGSRKFGAVGLSSPGGTGLIGPDDKGDKLLVLKDNHGCQSARIIGRRVAFLARVMKPVRLGLVETAMQAYPDEPNKRPRVYLSGLS